MASLKYWLWLTSRKGVDSVAALTALDYFLTPLKRARLPIPPRSQTMLSLFLRR